MSTKTEQEWRELLSPIAYHVTREGGTERPYTGALIKESRSGVYRCVCCERILFTSSGKFPSGCGWPAFHTEAEQANIVRIEDRSHGMLRTEVRCSACDAHLGHVFNDGPRQHGGERYCINSVCLTFEEDES